MGRSPSYILRRQLNSRNNTLESQITNQEVVQRYSYIDWLRIFAVLLLFPFHTARIFDPWPFYVKSQIQSVELVVFARFLNQWHMHLFFFLAGASTCLALRFRSQRQYVRERYRRLVVPLLFGILVIIPPQSYYRLFGDPRLVWPGNQLQFFTGGPQFHKSYFAFYAHFFNGIFPHGNFEWGHLWFLAYLFVFSVLALPFFRYLKLKSGLRFVAQFANFIQKPAALISSFIPIAIIEASLRGFYPDGNQNLYNDWANFLTYGTVFIYGFLFFSAPKGVFVFSKYWPISLAIAVTTSVVYLGFLLPPLLERSLKPYSISWAALMILRALSTWCWVIFLMGLGKTLFDFGGKVLNYARESALPIYILHQTIIVIVGFYILKTGFSDVSCFIIISCSSLLLTISTYEIIRHIHPLRFLFGMKLERK